MTQTRQELETLNYLLTEQENRKKYRKIDYMFPDTGTYAREHYTKHIQFMKAGATYPQRAIVGGNRVGKSEACHYEVACHATGLYPSWWEGKRFNKPLNILCLGVTHDSTRDVSQFKLLGHRYDEGSGLIPKSHLDPEKITTKPGTPNARGDAYIKHLDPDGKADGDSKIQFKSYVSGYEVFMGTEYDVILMDEEPPAEIYSEALMRTATTKGIIICCFTSLGQTLSDVVLSFLPDLLPPENGHVNKFKFTQVIGWADMPPHLGEDEKENIKSGTLPHQLQVRTTGIPSIGSGQVYPVAVEDYLVDPFPIPNDWIRAYGLDVGWNRTAAIWGAQDPTTKIWYLYREYYKGHAEPVVHSTGIQAEGSWIAGAIDPASKGRSQLDGKQLLQEYRELGLTLVPADNAVESGIMRCYQLLSTGQLKVFSTCSNFKDEQRLYRRNDVGHIVKTKDHLMDAFRYLISTGVHYAQAAPDSLLDEDDYRSNFDANTSRDTHTGY